MERASATRAAAALLGAVTLIVSSCRLVGPAVELELTLPALPEPWHAAGPFQAVVRYKDADAREVTERVRWNRTEAGAARVSLRLPKERVSVVLVTPQSVSMPALRFRPAAAVYPFHSARGGRLAAGWRHGAPAVELAPLASELGWGWFNFRRLLAELERVGAESLWWLQWRRIRAKLWEHAFRVSYLRQAELHEVRIPLPSGAWISVDPALPPLMGEGGFRSVALPRGAHRYLQPETRRELAVYVDDRGEAYTMLIDH